MREIFFELVKSAAAALWRWLNVSSFSKAIAICCYAILCMALLGVGPQIQQYVFGLLNSDATSIYEAVYKNSICCKQS